MSKPSSNLYPQPLTGRVDRQTGASHVRDFPLDIHEGKQGKHIPGHSNYDSSKSKITLTMKEIEDLVKSHANTGKWHGPNKEVIDFGTTIGEFIDQTTGKSTPTSRGTVHYSKSGFHVVPATPLPQGAR